MSRRRFIWIWIAFGIWFGLGYACDKWEFVNPVPQGNHIHDLHVIGSEVWAVGDFGLVMTTTDGENWTIHPRFTDMHLYGITYGLGQWMIVAQGGWIFTSTNGVDWLPADAALEDWYAVAFGTDDMGTDAFVVVGADGKTMHSHDGANWYTSMITGYSDDLLDVTFDTNRFVAVGENGCVAESSNLDDWTQFNVGSLTEPWRGVSRAASWLFLCGDNGTIFRTDQSIAGPWIDVSVPLSDPMSKVVAFDNSIYAIGGKVYQSNSGDVWTLQWNMVSPLNDGVVFSNIMVTAGTGGNHMYHTGTSVQHDPRMSSGSFNGICRGPDAFLAVSDFRVMSSADGVSWQPLTGVNPNLQDVTHFDGLYHAVSSTGAIISSADGVDWVEDYNVTGEGLFGIASSFLDAVAVGADGKVVKKDFGGPWAPIYLLGIDDLYDICYAHLSIHHGKFVAVGENGKIVTSPDGTTWSAASHSGTTNDLHSVAHYGGTYTAVGDQVILQSNDGDVWVPTHVFPQFSFDHVFWLWDSQRHGFCVFGTFAQDTVVFGTYDLSVGDWVMSFPRLSSPIYDTVSYDGQLVGVGGNSSIIVPSYPDLDLENWRQLYDVLDYTDEVNVFCQ